MREAFHHIRKKYIDAITGNISIDGSAVSIYNRVPTNAETPFIRIFSFQSEEADQNKTTFVSELTTRIEVITSYFGDDGGELNANKIVDGVLDIVRDRNNIDLSAEGFNVYYTNIERIRYFEDYEENETFFRAVIDVTNRVEKT